MSLPSAVLHDVETIHRHLEAAFPTMDSYLWFALLVGSIVLGVRHVRRHIRKRRSSLEGLAGKDKASLFRSAESVERKASYNPFYGRPAWLRGLPYPGAVVVAWMWTYHPILSGALTLAAAGGVIYLARRAHLVRMAHWTVTKEDHPLLALGWKAEEVIARPQLQHSTAGELLTYSAPLPDSFKVAHEAAAGVDLNARLRAEFVWQFDHAARMAYGSKPAVPDYPTDVRWRGQRAKRGLWLGIDLDTGTPIEWDRKSAPHGQIVGETGGGKTVFLTMLGVSWLVIDADAELLLCSTKPSGSWVSVLAQHPRVIGVHTEPVSIAEALHSVVADAERRQAAITIAGCDDDDEYHEQTGEAIGAKRLVITDEFEDLTAANVNDSDEVKAARKSAKGSAESLARKARSAGIHLLLGTQGASTGVITPPLWRNTQFKVVCGPIPKRYAEQALGVHGVPDVPGAEVDEVTGAPVEASRVPGRGLVRVSSTASVRRAQLGWLGPNREWLPTNFTISGASEQRAIS